MSHLLRGLLALACLISSQNLRLAAEPALNFNRDVRPILSDKCFACHGQDSKQRQADLRLDIAPEAGSKIIVAGKPQESELIKRIHSMSEEELMPPQKSHKQLSDAEKAVLQRWIEQGAAYEKHWAFIPPQRPAIPAGQSAIDYLVHQTLRAQQLDFSPEAAPEIWLRRVTLDLTGLPPTPQEIDDFLRMLKQFGASAYAVQVDRLLASPRYGERMAQEWLDVARYADTHGFNNDSAREMWRWRDWVIDAFNANMPYNQFITEQLAGDLLLNATLDQRIATGFCRNHVINSEGGIIEEEYRVEYVADRVRTMSTAWLGLTMECARCHDHKFDPVSQKDYYSLFAFFNNVPEHGEDGRIANAVPMIPAPTRQQQQELAALKAELGKLDTEIDKLATAEHSAEPTAEPRAEPRAAQAASSSAAAPATGATAASPANPTPISPENPAKNASEGPKVSLPEAGFTLDCEAAEPVDKLFKFLKQPPKLVEGHQGKAWRIGPNSIVELASGKINLAKRGTLSMWINPDVDCPNDVALLSSVNYQGNASAQGFAKGHEIRLVKGEIEIRTNDTFPAYAIRLRTEGARIGSAQWSHLVVIMGGTKKAINIQVFLNGNPLLVHTTYDGLSGDSVAGGGTYNLGAERTADAPAYRGCIDQLQYFPSELDAKQLDLLHGRQLSTDQPVTAMDALVVRRRQLWIDYIHKFRSLPTTMVMQELPEPRPTYVLKRGAYDAHGDQVGMAVPEQLLAGWPTDAPRNRLGLAKWLTQPDHPLTPRVVVNRIWAQLFGTGLVKTLEDFGFQGEYPSHPELMDWLARELVESDWNIKQLMRTIVLSKTYRQSSRVTSELLSRDPENRWLARAPRLRLSAEMLRDQALGLSGLLKERVGGPSVYPYQPEGLYAGLVVGADYPGTSWPTSQGDDRFRRTMYTFCKRTVPHPLMQTFDAPDREFCTARRMRTNTPLQALVLMNEPGFYEAAQQLGKRIEAEGGRNDASKIEWAFRLVTSRQPDQDEQKELLNALHKARGQDPHTAYTILASILLNLDETVTRP